MSQMLDPMFFRLADRGGPGWRCLRWAPATQRSACGPVGPLSGVVASDIIATSTNWPPNIEVRKIDVTQDALGDGYDLVCARAILHHIPQRIDVVRRLAAAVRPGGWILIEEPDFHPVMASTAP
jgi:trans-aconitate methyltransferase